METASTARHRWPGLQGQVLLAVGALVVAAALAVGVTGRAGARAAFRMFLDSEDAAVLEHARAVRPEIARALDGACCAPGQVDAAAARLGPDLALFVFDDATRAPIRMAGAPLVRLRDTSARWDGRQLLVDADRPAEGGSTEHLALRFEAHGVRIAASDGRAARLLVVPIPSAFRVRAAVAVLSPYDDRAVALILALAASAAGAAWLAAWRAARAARDIERALRDIAAGDVGRRVDPAGPRETADLARALNALADGLERRAPSSKETP